MSRPDISDLKKEMLTSYTIIMDDIVSQMQTIASYCVQQKVDKYYHNRKRQAVCSACAQKSSTVQGLTEISERHILYTLPLFEDYKCYFCEKQLSVIQHADNCPVCSTITNLQIATQPGNKL